jgi:tRNA-specific 2-thiouridylase
MKIAVGLSGGVDSSVAALLLKKEGHDVFAMFMQNWHDTTGTLHGDCSWEEELSVARMVAKKLEIPFIFTDLSDAYRKRVVDYMFEEYAAGRTPNPDVMCNREIKFDAFMEKAMEQGADFVATGHYCRKESFTGNDGSEVYRILAGTDPNKDQSYFLCQLTQQQLSKALFPIGHLYKKQVRLLAEEAGLPSADKKDSQGICFVGKVDLPLFLQQQLAPKEGIVVKIPREYYSGSKYELNSLKGYDSLEDSCFEEIITPYKYFPEDGKIIGKHQGAQFYTIGQRKGLNIGGQTDSLFIISTDIINNIIYVGEGQSHPGLYRKGIFIKKGDIHWIRPDLRFEHGMREEMLVRIRYRQPLQKAILIEKGGGLLIMFDDPQRGVTPGQFAVWYKGEEMVGSGVIS